MEIATPDLRLLKQRLKGPNLKKLLIEKNTNKYRVAKNSGITYRTLLNWQTGLTEPSDDAALLVGKHLGLIQPTEEERYRLIQELNNLKQKIERLG